MRIAQLRNILILIIMSMANAMAGETNNLITFAVSPDESLIYSVHEHTRQSDIMVHDTATGALIKKIPTALVSSVDFKPSLAITPNGKKLYIIDVNKLAYVLDLQTYKLSKVKNKPKQDSGFEYGNPASMMPDGKRLYVAEGSAQLRGPAVIHVIDTATNRADVAVRRKGAYEGGWFDSVMAFNNASALLYISREVSYYKYEISIFDTRVHRLMDEVISVERHMHAMAVHPVNGKLYVLEEGTVAIIDPVTRSVVDDFSIEKSHLVFGMAFAMNGSKLYVLDGGGMGKIHVIDTVTREVHEMEAGVFETGALASEIKVSEDGEKVYVSTLDGEILVVDAKSDKFIGSINTISH